MCYPSQAPYSCFLVEPSHDAHSSITLPNLRANIVTWPKSSCAVKMATRHLMPIQMCSCVIWKIKELQASGSETEDVWSDVLWTVSARRWCSYVTRFVAIATERLHLFSVYGVRAVYSIRLYGGASSREGWIGPCFHPIYTVAADTLSCVYGRLFRFFTGVTRTVNARIYDH